MLRILMHRTFIIVICLIFTACGGGGSNNQKPVTQPEIISQSITFEVPGKTSLYVGDTFANPASGPGSGLTSYVSSNTEFVTVDADGMATAISPGTATITAYKAADDRYAAATASYEISIDLQPNELTFDKSGPLKLLTGAKVANKATGLGNGNYHYRSSDNAIASVDGDGMVSVLRPGRAVITAFQSSDNLFSAGEASYAIESAPHAFSMTAWIGAEDSLVTFPSETQGIEFYRSAQSDCPIAEYFNCIFGQLDILDGLPISESAATTRQTAYYKWQHGNHRTDVITVSAQHFKSREGHQVVSHDGFLWLIGGNTLNSGKKNDVWKSSDGISWTLVTSNAAFEPRENHQVVSHDGKLWLIGGYISSSRMNDVWSSVDGKDWTKIIANAEFPARTAHQAASFNGKLWVIAGNAPSAKNDIWSSTDGLVWTQETASAAFSPREGHRVAIHDKAMWLVGGIDFGTRLNDVWKSADGVHWTQILGNAPFRPRMHHQLTSHASMLWVIGGDAGSLTNDVWSSSDGYIWTQETASAAFYPRELHQVASHQNRLLVIGGVDDNHISKNDIWSSQYGRDWAPASNGAPFSPRIGHATVEFHGKLWIIGGVGQTPTRSSKNNEIWSSENGAVWKLEKVHAEFSPRSLHQVINYAGSLWLVGGSDAILRNDVWRSDDGINWELMTNAAGFSPRQQHQLVVHQNKLWLIGGYDGGINGRNDIWWSTDGINWTEIIPENVFPARYTHQSVSFAGKLWVIGGFSAERPYRRPQIWSSVDGHDWVVEIESAPFKGRSDHQVVTYNNMLWLVGGLKGDISAEYENDIWNSSDGIQWNLVAQDPAFEPRRLHQVLGTDNALWMVGGIPDSFSEMNDVWRSSDGQNWRKLYQRNIEFPTLD